MAALNFFIGFLYELVRSAWMLSSVFMKFFLVAIITESVRRKDFTVQGFDEKLRNGGKYILLAIGLLAVPITLTGVSFQPFYLFESQFIAVMVLGYLFWKY